jgi:GNAT superfamily N-acetyltransferase
MNEEGFRIRPATPDDRDTMSSIINAAFAIESFLDGTRTDDARLTEMMKTGSFLVAEDNSSRIVASVYTEIRGTRGYLGVLAVDPSCQGRGLGRRMIEVVEDYCRRLGCVAMDITVLSLRPDLPPFYRKLGYVETGTEEFVTSRALTEGAECHCILMSKAL